MPPLRGKSALTFSRVHIVQEFNMGVYDYIIATDENAIKSDSAKLAVDNSGDLSDAQNDGKSPIVTIRQTR